eukprot:5229540-Pyramimonas_sp.AAC.1
MLCIVICHLHGCIWLFCKIVVIKRQHICGKCSNRAASEVGLYLALHIDFAIARRLARARILVLALDEIM